MTLTEFEIKKAHIFYWDYTLNESKTSLPKTCKYILESFGKKINRRSLSISFKNLNLPVRSNKNNRITRYKPKNITDPDLKTAEAIMLLTSADLESDCRIDRLSAANFILESEIWELCIKSIMYEVYERTGKTFDLGTDLPLIPEAYKHKVAEIKSDSEIYKKETNYWLVEND